MKLSRHLIWFNNLIAFEFKAVLVFVIAFWLCFPLVFAQFNDASVLLGTPQFTDGSPHGNGVSVYDFNKDGWDDLSFVGTNQQIKFKVNINGTFEDAAFSIPNPTNAQINSLLWSDYDNDGDTDLLITRQYASIQLWQNDGNFNFTNVAAAAGLEQANFFYSGAAFADYNHDGCLDLYIGKFYHSNFNPELEYRGILYKSNCDGTFAYSTEEAGVLVSTRLIFQPVFLDYNNDGWEDLYLVTDRVFFPNAMFHNNGDGTFTEVTETCGAGVHMDAMSGTIGDYDNDADLDIYVTNNPSYPMGHCLLQNQGDETFIQQQNELGLYLQQVGWGCLWLDYNNDSWQDLFVSVMTNNLAPIGNQFYVNDNGAYFNQQNSQVGLAGDPTETYTTAMGDVNNDGYNDFITNNRMPYPGKLYLNEGGDNNYFAFSLEGTLSNKDGIGTWVHCYAGGNHYVRYTLCGENLLGQNSSKMIFGLGEINQIDSLEIDWNRGTHEVYYDIEVNQHIHYIEGATFALPFNISLDGDNYLCPEDSIVLDAGEFATYLWNTGHQERYLTVFEPGFYQVTVTQNFGLPFNSTPVEIENAPTPETTISTQNITCFGTNNGFVEVEISNNPIEGITWNNNFTELSMSNLAPGIYSFIAFDSFGCQVIGTTEISEPLPLTASSLISDVSCFGLSNGSAQVLVSGGTEPYQIEVPEYNLDALPAGTYLAEIEDSNGCFLSTPIEISEPEEISLVIETTPQIGNEELGSAQIEISGGTAPYQIIWSNGIENVNQIDELTYGSYSVEIIDFSGCVSNLEFEIPFLTSQVNLEKDYLNIYPNPATNFVLVSGFETLGHIKLLSLSGKILINESTLHSNYKLDTTHLSPGTYIVQIESDKYQKQFLIVIL